MTDVDLSAKLVNINMTRNDGLKLKVTFPFDLTDGYTVTAQFRLAEDDVDAVPFTIVPVDLPGGIIEAVLTTVPRPGVYDIQTSKDGVLRTWYHGAITLEKDVTRP